MLLFDLLTNCERHGDVTKPVEIIAEGNVITVRNKMKAGNLETSEFDNMRIRKFDKKSSLWQKLRDKVAVFFGFETSLMKQTPEHYRSLALAAELLQKTDLGSLTFREEGGEWVVRIKIENFKN